MNRDRPYYCGWTIVRHDELAHFITAQDFPITGSSCRAWCGATVVVIGLSLNPRHLQEHCAECDQRLQHIATTPESHSDKTP